jgi:glycosyltransferase involved in cell wall biosynthesis
MGYHVMLCGNGKAQIEQNVRELVKSSNYPQLFELPGYEKSQDVLPSAEIFVSLQLYNNYPSQSLLEAIACGCCVVASDQGDTYRLVKEPFGLLCSFEEKNISEGVLRFAQMSDEDKKKAKEAARSFAEIQFSIGNSVSHYMKMIEEEKQE